MNNHNTSDSIPLSKAEWNHSTHPEFYEYYAQASQSEKTLSRFAAIRNNVLRILRQANARFQNLDVADIGCGAGTQSILWASMAHRVHGLDVNEALVRLAIDRAANSGLSISFEVGVAENLPWADESMDICLAPELLEHVQDWRRCLMEFVRILRPGGLLFLSTSNRLCPVQQEFNLPLYSWYPAFVKHHYEALARTTRPELANYATYPAVHWFSFFKLRNWLANVGFRSFDRFDIVDLAGKGLLPKTLVQLIRIVPFIRWLAHVLTPYTVIYAIKKPLSHISPLS